MVLEVPLTRQYEMAAACQASTAHLALAEMTEAEEVRQSHFKSALEASAAALEIYESFGFVQIIECLSEEVYFRHALALSVNGNLEAAGEFLQKAYDEMMRKYALIPEEHHYRKTYIESIPLHRQISTAQQAAKVVVDLSKYL